MIIPASNRATETELRAALDAFLATRPYGEADFKTIFFNLPRYIKLSLQDREVARERDAELKWQTIVRNVHRTLSKLDGRSDGVLVARRGGGFQLASRVKPPVPTPA